MKPENRSRKLLAVTRSQSKMYEYGIPDEHHIKILTDPARLFVIAIGLLGDLSAKVCAEEATPATIAEDQQVLRFAAHFFDAYDAAQFDESLKPYLTVVGAATYYLCDLQGNASVLAKRLGEEIPDLGSPELSRLLVWLVKGDFTAPIARGAGPLGLAARRISLEMSNYVATGDGEKELFSSLDQLRGIVYQEGSARQLLFADTICALAKKRYWNSAWYCLPLYSGLSKKEWGPTLRRDGFLRELWPAQHLLGEVGIFRGQSAVVQMPTSAGKTHATELILRSSFLSKRTTLAVVVAPFRALCHEIQGKLRGAFEHDSISVDELTDVLQTDFDVQEIFGRRQVLVVTPEKLVYFLRQHPELAARIGLVIYDEGHQFDNGIRGVTYELLLTTLNHLLPAEAQVLLISAVISNAEALNGWLNKGKAASVVKGQGLAPTYRTLGFATWQYALGQISFVSPSNPDENEFFVPRVLEQANLAITGKEKERVFPLKDDGGSIALYLGLKLAAQGGVAIFCGRKDSASGLCKAIVEVYRRGYAAEKPVSWSNHAEVARLHYLHEMNLGAEAAVTASAKMGIFTHHANIPHGLRRAVEHAMQRDLARFVICTSTLAQGVNLPLRYLIVTSTQQGGEAIKVRDFHNLIGRAGRSGMHTEGSILFADAAIYDTKTNGDENWRWNNVKKLLEPGNSEPCASKLLSLFEPLRNDGKGRSLRQIKMEPLTFVETYVDDSGSIGTIADTILERHPNKEYTKRGLEDQIANKLAIIKAVEGFLMAAGTEGSLEEYSRQLAEGTLAYHLAGVDERKSIVGLFKLLASHIERRVPDHNIRAVFGRTLCGVVDSLAIEHWVKQNLDTLTEAPTQDDLFELLWPLFYAHIQNKTFRNCQSPAHLKQIALGWFSGKSFSDLHAVLATDKIKIGRFNPTVEHVVEICEGALSFEGMLVVNAVREVFALNRPEDGITTRSLDVFQKRLKYGLENMTAVIHFEIGFSDRVISSELAALTGGVRGRAHAIGRLRRTAEQAREAIAKYPSYFSERLEAII